ncbi:MAG: AI-2E family transporter [Akkermansiaceae bacterium]
MKLKSDRVVEKSAKSAKSAEGSKIILILAALVIVIAGMRYAADFILPILLAFFIATISFPITNWLREHKVPRAFAVLITVIVDFAFLTGVVFLGIVLTTEFQSKWESKYQALTEQRTDQLIEFTTEFYEKWGLKGKEVPEESLDETTGVDSVVEDADEPAKDGVAIIPEDAPAEISRNEGTPVLPVEGGDADKGESLDDQSSGVSSAPVVATKEVKPGKGIEQLGELFKDMLSRKNILDWIRDALRHLLSIIGTSFVIMLLTVFMLSEARMFGRRFNAICEAQGPNLQRMLSATKDIQKYLGIKTLISMATGLLAGILCWQMGLEFPLLWGILAFALNFIPAVGSVIAGIPPVLLSLLNNGSLPDAAIIGGGYLIINGFLGNFLEPTLLGRRFGISTVVVILSVLFWGWLWGPIGMLMAVPLTMLLKVAMDNSSDFRWIAVAISKESKKNEAENEIIIKEAVEAKVQALAEDRT